MENEEIKNVKKEKEKKQEITIVNHQSKKLTLLFALIIIVLIVVFVIPNKEGQIKTSVKSTLEKIVEKSDLETVNFTYNVIAKKCKDMTNCNLQSNDIDDFDYVVSCKGTLTSGIDFSKVLIDVDKKSKKLIVTMPEASIKDINIGSIKFLNGEDVPASELPNARRLCEETSLEKSKKDANILSVAKEQAAVVLESFYKEWLKVHYQNYQVEVR